MTIKTAIPTKMNLGDNANTAKHTSDTTPPTLTISSDKATLKAGETAELTFTFSEAIKSFAKSDIDVTGGTLSKLSGTGLTRTATFTPTGNINTLSGVISVAEGSYTDKAGNSGSAGNTLTLTGDTAAPSLAISSSKTAFKAGDTGTVTFTFSEAPTGFTASDVTTTGGSLSTPTVTADSKVYTALFTPTANTNTITGAISVAADSYTDAAGNKGAAGNTLTLTGDTLAPTLVITSSSSSLSAGQTAALTFTFSETPTGFDASDITVAGGSLGALSGTGLIRTATFTPTANSSGVADISVASGSYTDAAGNAGGAGVTPSLSYYTIVGGGGGGGTPGPTTQSLDALTSSQQTPATFNAGTGAFILTDTVATASFVRVSNFGADDAIAISGGGSNHLIVANDGSDVTFIVNNGGIVSQITVVGVASASQIIGDLSAFNALAVGDASYS